MCMGSTWLSVFLLIYSRHFHRGMLYLIFIWLLRHVIIQYSSWHYFTAVSMTASVSSVFFIFASIFHVFYLLQFSVHLKACVVDSYPDWIRILMRSGLNTNSKRFNISDREEANTNSIELKFEPLHSLGDFLRKVWYSDIVYLWHNR